MDHSTLVIHPRDETTRFLELAYQGVDATVVTGRVPRARLQGLMEKFDQIVMLGHGSWNGLYSAGQFPECPYVIDDQVVDLLRERDNNVFVWCFASDFVRKHRLRGFATGMFISEVQEAELFELTVTDEEIQESNRVFADVVGRHLNKDPRELYAAVDDEYGTLAACNPVAEYNHALLELFERGTQGHEIPRPHEESSNVCAAAAA
ncbi:MAG: hypothetical protein WD078_07495 [Woeseia sp.]